MMKQKEVAQMGSNIADELGSGIVGGEQRTLDTYPTVEEKKPDPPKKKGSPVMPGSRQRRERVMQDTSEDAFDNILNSGLLGEMYVKAKNLVEDNPDMTVRELLRHGVDTEVYNHEDRNAIAPRITGLVREGIIYRPYKRICEVTGMRVFVHRMMPKNTLRHRTKLFSSYKRPFVKHRMEIASKTVKDLMHTVIKWIDGKITCTCHDTYHRPSDIVCHHAEGMEKADTGKDLKGSDCNEK